MKPVLSKGFTLYELLVVIMIVAVVAAVALPNFGGLKERALGKEAKANLKLMVKAERNYLMESGGFYPSSSTATDLNAINANLSLSLTNTSWDYSVTGGQSDFTAYAARKGAGGYLDCQYSLSYNISNTSNAEEPTGNANCPS